MTDAVRRPPSRGGPGSGGRGFTLIETIVALTISSVVVVLVSTLWLVQNRYYAIQVERSGAQDVARAVTELIGTEVRSTAAGGIVVAEADSLVIRSPMAIGGICRSWGRHAAAPFEGGVSGLDTDEIAGFAVHDMSTGTWSFYNEDWDDLFDRLEPGDCADNGADTAGAADEFIRLADLDQHHGSIPPEGTLLMLFRETTFAFRPSELDPASRGLYRGSYGEDLVEYANGLDTTAQFQYRLSGSSTYLDAVGSLSLDLIDAVRVVADTRRRPAAGGVDDITFGWSVNIPVRNVR